MNSIISIDSLYLDLVEPDGTCHWIAVATIADMVELRPAIYHPADLAEPAEYGPAICSAGFSLAADDDVPPMHDTEFQKIQYLESLDLNWEIDDEEI